MPFVGEVYVLSKPSERMMVTKRMPWLFYPEDLLMYLL